MGIVFLLQVFLSPLWIWLAFGDAPPLWTVLGGLLIFATLIGHELAMYRERRAEPAMSAAPPASAARASEPTLELHAAEGEQANPEQV